ncbi:MAG: twin-arginine translocase subunit TatB [Alphaproteobacteria bacterium]|nr:twin-arginine translocase subunit TatB [Alphaproteobacteria bacterium]
MLDIGWVELSIIALITILVVGPKEIPRVLRTVTQIMRKVRGMASEFQSGIDELAREAELDDLKKDIEKTASRDFASELENTIDPTGEVTESVREIETSLKEDLDGDSATKNVAEAIQESAPQPPADEPEKPAAKTGEGA